MSTGLFNACGEVDPGIYAIYQPALSGTIAGYALVDNHTVSYLLFDTYEKPGNPNWSPIDIKLFAKGKHGDASENAKITSIWKALETAAEKSSSTGVSKFKLC